MSAAVGADVESLCNKCGDVWHVVVAKVGEQIVKVQCKQCGGQHRHKSPHGAPKALKLPKQIRPEVVREPKAETTKTVERFEKPAVAADLSKAVRPYRASEQFEVGDRIDHVNFGQGVVETAEPGKITVFFATGRRVLVQSKAGAAASAGLTRPKPFDHSVVVPGGKPVSETK